MRLLFAGSPEVTSRKQQKSFRDVHSVWNNLDHVPNEYPTGKELRHDESGFSLVREVVTI
jgi:hypothetical protein